MFEIDRSEPEPEPGGWGVFEGYQSVLVMGGVKRCWGGDMGDLDVLSSLCMEHSVSHEDDLHCAISLGDA